MLFGYFDSFSREEQADHRNLSLTNERIIILYSIMAKYDKCKGDKSLRHYMLTFLLNAEEEKILKLCILLKNNC